MLRREGSSPDLLALRRETEALNRQAAKLAERGQGRLALIEEAEERVKEFYARLTELQGLLDRAEEGLNAQGVVGTEVDIIKQQLQEFKVGDFSGWSSFVFLHDGHCAFEHVFYIKFFWALKEDISSNSWRHGIESVSKWILLFVCFYFLFYSVVVNGDGFYTDSFDKINLTAL